MRNLAVFSLIGALASLPFQARAACDLTRAQDETVKRVKTLPGNTVSNIRVRTSTIQNKVYKKATTVVQYVFNTEVEAFPGEIWKYEFVGTDAYDDNCNTITAGGGMLHAVP